MNDIRRPRKYEDAVKDKESAREEIEVYEHSLCCVLRFEATNFLTYLLLNVTHIWKRLQEMKDHGYLQKLTLKRKKTWHKHRY